MTGLRPLLRPRTVAAARPARVRSWIRSRSNWPSAPKDEPSAGRGGVDGLGQKADPDAAVGQRGDGLDQVGQRAPKPVQLPNDQHLAVPHDRSRAASRLGLRLMGGGADLNSPIIT